MSRQHCVVGKNDMRTNLAIVRNVHAAHDQVVATNFCNASSIASAAMNGRELANVVAVTHLKRGALAGKFFILGRTANNGEWVQHILTANARVAIHMNMAD